jgi:hypothetical protein
MFCARMCIFAEALMANTRGSDERLAYKAYLSESVGPGSYQLERPHACAPTFIDDARMSSGGHLASVCADVPLVDVDSELLGLTRKLGSCPESRYTPGSTPFCRLRHVPADARTNADFASEDCRLSNPACTLRGTGWNRWEWLCQDPQSRATEPFERVVNYRTIVKDNHRPLIETPLTDRVAPDPRMQSPPKDAEDLRDLQCVLSSFPAAPPGKHWRELREVRAISGDCACGV